MNLELSAQESSLYEALFRIADSDKDGKIGVPDAAFLVKSGLPQHQLGEVNLSVFLSSFLTNHLASS